MAAADKHHLRYYGLLRQKQRELEKPAIFRDLSGDGLSAKGRRWTPPLSPSVGKIATPLGEEGENLPTAGEFVVMLRRPGMPALASVVDLKKAVHEASRAWIRDFRIRGGR